MCAVTILAASIAAAAPVGLDDSSASAERRVALERRFNRIDRNGDGLVAANEAPRKSRSRCDADESDASQPSNWLDVYDADRDGRVSLREFVAGSGRTQVAARAE